MKDNSSSKTWLMYRWFLNHPLVSILVLIVLALLIGAVGYELAGAWKFNPIKMGSSTL